MSIGDGVCPPTPSIGVENGDGNPFAYVVTLNPAAAYWVAAALMWLIVTDAPVLFPSEHPAPVSGTITTWPLIWVVGVVQLENPVENAAVAPLTLKPLGKVTSTVLPVTSAPELEVVNPTVHVAPGFAET